MSQKKKEESSIEDVSSDENQSAKSKSDVSFEKEDIDMDTHRFNLAKKIINDAKATLGLGKRVKKECIQTASIDQDEQDSQKSEDVNQFLQAKVAEKKKTLNFNYYDQIYMNYLKNDRKLEPFVLKAHKRPITACCFNPVTNDLVSVGKDGAIVLFDFASGFKRRLLNPGFSKNKSGHTDEVLCLDISHDGKYLITAGKDKSLKVWNLGAYSQDLETMKKNIIKGDFAIKTKNSSLVIGHRKLSTEIAGSFGQPIASKLNGHSKNGSSDSLKKIESLSEVVPKNMKPYVEKHPELILLTTLSGHRDSIHAVKFRHNSYECVTASADRSLKVWDVAQQGLIETLFGHRNEMLDIDNIANNIVSVGFDKLPIIFKLDRETQMIFDEQLFSLDCVKSVNQNFFLTGSQDGSVALWNIGKKKPLRVIDAHCKDGWVSSITGIYNSDFFITGGIDSCLKFWKIDAKNMKDHSIEFGFDLSVEGVINCMALSKKADFLAVVESPENRLGRWTTSGKVCSKIKIFKLTQK